MISVLMMTYNREKMVSHAIESILSQTYGDFEYVIVDHGSTDGSGAIVEEYAKKDNRIRVIHCKPGTIGEGRNIAIEAAKGEYITFIDDDDSAEPDILDFLHSLMIDNKADISICGTTERSCDEKKVMTAEEALIEMMWRKKYTVRCSAKMFKSLIVKRYKYPEAVRFDDIAVNYKFFADADRIAYHGLPKYNICRHDGNESSWTKNPRLLSADILDEYLAAYNARTDYLSARFPNSASAFRYFKWSFMISMVEKINRFEIKGCENQLEYMTSVLEEHCESFLSCPELQAFEREWMEEYINIV